jgi:hypothetical protein
MGYMCRSYGTLKNGRFYTRGLKSTATILTVPTALLVKNVWIMYRVLNSLKGYKTLIIKNLYKFLFCKRALLQKY